MESVNDELDRTLRRARFHYEWMRARRALLGFLPVFGLVGAVCALSDQPERALASGIILFLLGAAVLWYGRDLRRAVLPGVAAGLLPISLVFGAEHLGHACGGSSCTSLCLAACVAGGFLAGGWVTSSKTAREARVAFWVAASAVALLTGAMACARLGIAGMGGLLFGYGVGALPGCIRRLLTKTG